jgi:predicted ATP-binding protein involved in virulence
MAKKASKQPNSRNGASRPSAAYFLSLSLENVRCFRDKQTLDLSDGKGGPARWTILLGNNGTGKTTILQALAAFVWLSRTYLREQYPAYAGQPGFVSSPPAFARALFHRDDKAGELKVDFTHMRGFSGQRSGAVGTSFIRFGPESKFVETRSTPLQIDGQPTDFPCFCGYGASRRLGSSGLSDPECDEPGLTLFSDRTTLRNAEEWLLRLDYAASKGAPSQERRVHYERIRALLLAILEETKDLQCETTEGVNPVSHVEFQTPYGSVPLRALGYGYQTLIAWMVDFASRLVERYPNSPDPLAEPALVLVDEIDLHLHPQWQRKLIGHLTEHFPNTQFVATAHSPLIVQAAEDANIALLRREGDQVVIDNDVKTIRGWRIDQIYTSDLFGLPSARPPEMDEPMARRKELLLKTRHTPQEEKELKNLEAVMESLPGGETREQTETLRLIREALENLQDEHSAAP